MISTRWLEQSFAYDGSQLRSLFGYLEHKVMGDSVIAWRGPCNVAREHMVDGEDWLAGESIAGDEMVHFIIEKFNASLLSAVTLQRLFASLCIDILRAHVGDDEIASQFRREGDDIFFSAGKMSISIATVSPVSALIHFAVNVTNAGTPVRTAALADIDFEAREFAEKAMAALQRELASIEQATVKVRWVR